MRQKASLLLALAAVLITIFSVWYGQRPVAPKQATWQDVLTEAMDGGYQIITTEALAERYAKAPLEMTLVDTRQEWEYRTGHIEGALNFPMEPTRWARWHKSDDLAEFLGPDKERTFIFY